MSIFGKTVKPIKRRRKTPKFSWVEAPDIKERALKLVDALQMDTILFERLFFYRSDGSKARAYARTWGLPKLWQAALEIEPAYIIEVITKYFDKLPRREQDKVILHELSHIPKNFSGALIPHTRHRKGSFHDKLDELVDRYFANEDLINNK